MDLDNGKTLWNSDQSDRESIPQDFRMPELNAEQLEVIAGSHDDCDSIERYKTPFDESSLAVVVA